MEPSILRWGAKLNAKLSSGQNEARFAPFETIYTPFDSTSRDLSIGTIKKIIRNLDLGVLATP